MQTSGALSIISNINKDLVELNLSDNLLNSRNLKKIKEHTRKTPKDLTSFGSFFSTRNYNKKDKVMTPTEK